MNYIILLNNALCQRSNLNFRRATRKRPLGLDKLVQPSHISLSLMSFIYLFIYVNFSLAWKVMSLILYHCIDEWNWLLTARLIELAESCLLFSSDIVTLFLNNKAKLAN